MDEGTKLRLYIRYDSEGFWEESGVIFEHITGTVTVPVRPRRCDHLQIKLQGTGNIRIFSLARILEVGSDK